MTMQLSGTITAQQISNEFDIKAVSIPYQDPWTTDTGTNWPFNVTTYGVTKVGNGPVIGQEWSDSEESWIDQILPALWPSDLGDDQWGWLGHLFEGNFGDGCTFFAWCNVEFELYVNRTLVASGNNTTLTYRVSNYIENPIISVKIKGSGPNKACGLYWKLRQDSRSAGGATWEAAAVSGIDYQSGTTTKYRIEAVNVNEHPIKLSDFYRGGERVPDNAENARISTSGTIKFSQFYGSTKAIAFPAAGVTYGPFWMGGPYGTFNPLYITVSRNADNTVTYNYWTGNTYCGTSPGGSGTVGISSYINEGRLCERFEIGAAWRKGCCRGNDNNFYVVFRIETRANNTVVAYFTVVNQGGQWGC